MLRDVEAAAVLQVEQVVQADGFHGLNDEYFHAITRQLQPRLAWQLLIGDEDAERLPRCEMDRGGALTVGLGAKVRLPAKEIG
jgi:hypothetical protein